MSLNLKIGLALGVLALILGVGFGYLQLTKNNGQLVLIPTPALSVQPSPSVPVQPQQQVNSVDQLVDSLLSDAVFESSLSSQESGSLDQSLTTDSQAISNLGKSYDPSEL